VQVLKNNFDLGLKLRQLRLDRALSQEQVANIAEITPAYYGQVERGTKNVTVRRLEKICDALDVSLAEVFSDTMPQNDKPVDELSKQILFQLHGKTNDDKKSVLKIIKQIFAMNRKT
jgi:transcriptional regulator with XRE-family HTH domain